MTLLALAGWTRAEQVADDPHAVVATVGTEPVLTSEVERLVARIAGSREIAAQARPLLQARALEEIVRRRLVLAYAKRTGEAPDAAAIDRALAALRARLAAQGKSLDDHLRAQQVTETALRRQVAGQIVWDAYLARYLTDTRIQAYFEAHHRALDGTELRVSQVLLKAEGNQTRDTCLAEAERIRAEITSGKLSFADAARRYSQAPSAAAGGAIGWITRSGPMVEAFSAAAFALEKGELSGPVVTPHGVHLICVDQVRAGRKTWSDVRPQIEEALAGELLGKLSRIQRAHTPVRYTGAGPHLDPDSGMLGP